MSTNRDILRRLAGTTGLDLGGEALVNALLDKTVVWVHDAIDAAAGDTINANIWRNTTGYDLELVSAQFIPDAALTAADATKLTLSVLKGASAAVSTSAASVNTATSGSGGSGDWVADTPVTLTISSTLADRVVSDNQIVAVDKAVTSTGTKLPAGCLYLKFRLAE